MNENTFLDLGNNNQASQPMDMNAMGGDASSMPPAPGADPMMGTDPDGGVVGEQGDPGDPNAMADPNGMADPNTPVMGADPFDDEGDADVSGDPEKKAESLAGQLASIFRNDLNGDGINKHEDKKKEVLGMIASAVVDGMNDEDRNSMIEYLSDKLNGSGESDGDENGNNDMDQDMGDDTQMDSDIPDNMGDDNAMMGGEPDTDQQMIESKVNEIVEGIVKEITGGVLNYKKKEEKTKIDNNDEKKHSYAVSPYRR